MGKIRKQPHMPRERHRLRHRPEKTLGFHLRLLLGTETAYNNQKIKIKTITKSSKHHRR